ncbi:hypothetical protein [Microbacterium sp. lyk4-40-TSB-66]|uniref:hypothetical protein n=1 Tax=Microbacterium sp. lyk4-40-TSB-66 TaxID=3040294 RepID=UPI0025510F9C|nr:hypothetical protein [Microbacterium sp. lyk4-40-TSB-66]
MTEPQVWVLIGTFAAAVLGGMTFSTNLIMGSLTKVITANTDRLEARIDALRTETVSEFQVTRFRIDSVETGLTAKIDSVEARLTSQIESVESRLRGDMARIDSDVTAIAKRVWTDPPAA